MRNMITKMTVNMGNYLRKSCSKYESHPRMCATARPDLVVAGKWRKKRKKKKQRIKRGPWTLALCLIAAVGMTLAISADLFQKLTAQIVICHCQMALSLPQSAVKPFVSAHGRSVIATQAFVIRGLLNEFFSKTEALTLNFTETLLSVASSNTKHRKGQNICSCIPFNGSITDQVSA